VAVAARDGIRGRPPARGGCSQAGDATLFGVGLADAMTAAGRGQVMGRLYEFVSGLQGV